MSSNEWYYVQDRQKVGPVSKEELRSLFDQGTIAGADLVWTQGMSEWKPASQVQARFAAPLAAPAVAPPASPPASEGGGMEPAIDMEAPAPSGEPAAVATAEPARGYDVGEGLGIERKYAPTTEHEYAHFGLRLVAIIIDYLIVVPLNFIIVLPGYFFVITMFSTTDEFGVPQMMPVGSALAMGLNLLSAVIPWLYFARQESGIKMATIGKRVVGIQVIDTDGYPISFLRATGRYFAKIISAFPCLIGFLFPLFTPKKQALHDMIAGTLVVRAK